MSTTRGLLGSTSTVALVLCALAAWLVTVSFALDMPAGPGTMGFGLVGFVALWTVMMAAMMLPSISPVVSLYLHRLRSEPAGRVRALRTSALVVGYLSAWACYGIVAFALARLGQELAARSPDEAPWVGAGALVAAGVYQLTPLKEFCLSHCRSPISFLLRYGSLKGRTRDLRVGLHHGALCVGCCWGLMVVLVVVGVMSLGWMAAIAAGVLLEKTWRYGRALSRVLGVALIVLAVFVPAHPELLPGLHQTMSMWAPSLTHQTWASHPIPSGPLRIWSQMAMG
jgi:predicted metal-binding membrane protein